MQQTRLTKKKRRKLRRKRVFRVFLLFFLLSIIGGGTFLAFSTSKLSNAVYQEVDQSKFNNQRIANVEVTKDPFNVLLVGIEDQGGGAK